MTLRDVQCEGKERNLLECNVSKLELLNCDPIADAGVVCQGTSVDELSPVAI